jgi:hypothetical protein
MGRGIYSALGRWPDAQLASELEGLRAIGRELARGVPDDELGTSLPDAPRAALLAAVREIRAFEARVGQPTGLDAEIVTTPAGRAIELGNRGHLAFGAQHEEAAAVVARALANVLAALGATDTFGFTMD